MASRSAAENLCQCETWINARIPSRHCPCRRVIENKHVLCRPCALDWHDGVCDTFYREPDWPRMKLCARCGHDSALHPPRNESHWFHELGPRFLHLIGDPNAPKAINDVNDWEKKLTPTEFRESGLLWAVNRFVLWPLGHAVGVDIESDGGYMVLKLATPEVIVSGEINVAMEPEGRHPADRFVAFAKARISEMPEEDARLAREMLAPIVPDVLG